MNVFLDNETTLKKDLERIWVHNTNKMATLQKKEYV